MCLADGRLPTLDMAGLFAKKLGARLLVMIHFSQRYKHTTDNEYEKTTAVLLDEAKESFCAEDVIASYDLLVVPIPVPSRNISS